MYNKENDIIKFRQRALFGGMSFIYILLLIGSIIIAILLIQTGYLAILGVLCLIIAAFFLQLTLNIHGVDIVLNEQRIIVYRKILWYKSIKTEDLKHYKLINITKDKVVVETSEYSDYDSDTYFYYFLSLFDELNMKRIVLAESIKYKEIVNAARFLSKELNIEIKDKVFGRPLK